jgi:putative ABC transport system substrate-binding protein
MRRREFITLLGGAAAAWPLAARAQQPERVRHIGVLLGGGATGRPELAAFVQALQQLGWTDGRNLKTEVRAGLGNAADTRKFAQELVALVPDVIFVSGVGPLTGLLEATRTIPIVFTSVADPVGTGVVESMSRPGGNATGFIQFEYSLSGKWLELLKEIAPGVMRAAVLRDQTETAGALARTHGVAEVRPVDLQGPSEIERAIMEFAREPNGGLITTPNSLAIINRELIIDLAARYKLPAIYPFRFFAESGGLLAYGPDVADQYRRAAAYVDRILKGVKPGELPVEQSTKLDLILNVKTAKALGIEVPAQLLARADEVIE